MPKYPFMGVIADCLEATGHDPEYVRTVRDAFIALGRDYPELAARYDYAFPRRLAGEIENLLILCDGYLHDGENHLLGALRVNAITKRFYMGTGRSVPLFPYVQGI